MSVNENSPTKPEDGSNKPTTPRTSLEDASKDDLIKQIKKQLVLLQKTKNKCDELSKKNSSLEQNLKEIKQNADESRDQATKEHSILKDECESRSKKYREALEELDCMRSKENSLTSVLTCLQEDVNKLAAENKELKRYRVDTEDVREKCEEEEKNLRGQIRDLKLENEKFVEMLRNNEDTMKTFNMEIENLRHVKHALETRQFKLASEMNTLQEQLNNVVKEKESLKNKCQDFDDMALQLDELRVCLDEIQNENVLLHTELKNAASERDQLLFQENREEPCTHLEEQIQHLESEIEDLKNKLEGAEFEAEEIKAKLEEKTECNDFVDTKGLKMELEAFKMREKQCRDIMDDLFSPEDKFEFKCDEDDESCLFKKLNQVKLKVSEMQSEMEKLTFEIQDKGVELIELQEKFACNENESSSATNVLQSDEIELLKEEKQRLEDEFDKLKKMDLKHEDQLFACEEEMKGLKNSLKEKDDELTKLKSDLQRVKSEFESFNSLKTEELQNLLTVKNNLEDEINKFRNTAESVNIVNEEKKVLEDELNSLNVAQNELSSQKEKLEDEVNNLKNKLAEQKLESVNVVNNDFEMKMEEFEKQIHSAKEEINTLTDEKTKIQENLNSAQDSMQILQQEKTILEDEVAKLSLVYDEKTKLHVEIQELRVQLEEETGKSENSSCSIEMEKQRAELENKLISAKEEVNILISEKMKIQENLNSTEDSVRVLQEEKKVLEDEIIKLGLEQDEKNKLEDEIVELKTQLEEEKDKSVKFSFEVQQREEFEKKIISVKDEVSQLIMEKENLRAEIIQSNDNLEQEKIQLLKKIRDEFEEKFREVDSLRKQNETLNDEISQLKSKLREETTKNENLVKDDIEQELVRITAERDSLLIRPDLDEFNDMANYLKSIQEKLEMEKTISTNYKKDLDKTVLDLAVTKSQLMDLKAEKDCHKSEITALASEKKETIAGLNAKISVLIFEKDKISSKLEDITSESRELKESNRLTSLQLEQEKERHLKTINQLEQLQQQFKQQKLTNLEFADYERLVNELNQQVKKLQDEIDKLNQELNSKDEIVKQLRVELEQVGVQRTKSDERASKLKLLLVKLKKELAEMKRLETERNNNEIELRYQIEAEKQKSETYQMDIANLTNENQKLQESIVNMKESHQRLIRALELRVTSTQSELNLVRKEFDKCNLDYENYKVRVHSVLKQQKNKTPSPTNREMEENEREILEKTIDQLKLKLQDANDQSLALKTEYATLREEYDRLSLRYEKCLQDLQEKEEEFKERLDNLTLEENSFKDQHTEMVKELRHQNEAVIAAYKEQMQNMTLEHERVVKDLKTQLNATEQEMWKWQRDVKPMSREEMEVFDVSNTERQEGEGSENTEPTLGTPVQYQADQLLTTELSLEQLLNPIQKKSGICASVSQQEVENLEQQFVSCVRKVDHLTELLNESEASNMRLTEQTRVLKEEIRRLERNQEREEHTANMEYLKNIILKFVTLGGGDERERLVPVLTMMLRLSPQEKSQLNSIAKGSDQPSAEGDAVSWGSYLPRWSGLV